MPENDEKLIVYALDEQNGEPTGVVGGMANLLDAIKASVEMLQPGEQAEFIVYCQAMTQAEIDALPEA